MVLYWGSPLCQSIKGYYVLLYSLSNEPLGNEPKNVYHCQIATCISGNYKIFRPVLGKKTYLIDDFFACDIVTMPEIRETMKCGCAEFEQRISSLKLEVIFLFSIYTWHKRFLLASENAPSGDLYLFHKLYDQYIVLHPT